jgi:hypothetical protein
MIWFLQYVVYALLPSEFISPLRILVPLITSISVGGS